MSLITVGERLAVAQRKYLMRVTDVWALWAQSDDGEKVFLAVEVKSSEVQMRLIDGRTA